ncbi:hypothetical protein ACFZB9_23060 [Kitasatospora sp. NPDC008050]|uniref:hypothetical protein n=1 Tax=Kitasatospora sp. NPDC008050 TaxID=3364021 RepID=UPI0036EEB27A
MSMFDRPKHLSAWLLPAGATNQSTHCCALVPLQLQSLTWVSSPVPPPATSRHLPLCGSVRFGGGDLRQAFWPVDLLESAGYQGPRHFDFKPPRTDEKVSGRRGAGPG